MTAGTITSPYARLLGVDEAPAADGTLGLAAGDPVQARPSAMHGGAVASFLEAAGIASLRAAVRPAEGAPAPRLSLTSMTVDYLRPSPMASLRAQAEIVKLGGRVATLAVKAWADDPGKPVAAARLSYLIQR